MDDEKKSRVRSRRFALLRDIRTVRNRVEELDRFTGQLRSSTGSGKDKRQVGFHKVLEELEAARDALMNEMEWTETRKDRM